MIDGFGVLLPLFIVMALLFGQSDAEDGFHLSLSGLPFLVYLALSFGYFFVMEFNGGQTLGGSEIWPAAPA